MKNLISTFSRLLGMTLLLGLFASAAHAQATRTWVSGVGDDANPCSRTAPCKTFAGAISKTAAQGVISVLDPGGFGAVTITKSITIENDGAVAGILSAGTSGVIVNAGVNDNVTLRGISIDGANTGIDGVRFLNGGSLTIERCVINGVLQKGINFAPSSVTSPSSLTVNNTQIHNANDATNGGAISIAPSGGQVVTATLNNVQLTRSLFGVKATAPSKVFIRDSTIANNSVFGIQATGSGSSIVMDDSIISGNGGAAVTALSSGSVVLSRDAIFGNSIGLTTIGGGTIQSFGDNRNFGNTTPGAPSAPALPLQ
ncbi:MAG: right-handed parallel beta-helix repeat-containing protein [Tahibacter sp.]